MTRKIEFAIGSTIESAVYELLAAKARGEQVYGDFNGHKLYSDTVTMDSAYTEIMGCTKAEFDKRQAEWRENYKKEEQAPEQREQGYSQMVASTRIPGQDVVITMPTVIEGLKFIAENQTLSQEELIKGLLDLGCNFTLEDIKKQFPGSGLLFEGMKKGEVACGASVIANARDSEYGRAFCDDRFLSLDDETSIYHFVRIVTGDPSYTKDNLDISKSSSGRRK